MNDEKKIIENHYTIENYAFFCKLRGYSCAQASVSLFKEWLDEKRDEKKIICPDCEEKYDKTNR